MKLIQTVPRYITNAVLRTIYDYLILWQSATDKMARPKKHKPKTQIRINLLQYYIIVECWSRHFVCAPIIYLWIYL